MRTAAYTRVDKGLSDALLIVELSGGETLVILANGKLRICERHPGDFEPCDGWEVFDPKSRVGQTWEYDHDVVMVVVRSEDMSKQIGTPIMNHTGLILMSGAHNVPVLSHNMYYNVATLYTWYEVGPWEELDDRERLA